MYLKPYGDTIDYDNDLFERIESGELTQIDSLKNNKFRRNSSNIYSPIDTSKYNDQVNEIIYTRKWRIFALITMKNILFQILKMLKNFTIILKYK